MLQVLLKLGCLLEVKGLTNNQPKAYADGMLKQPIVLTDMMIDISTRSNASLNDLVLVGYNISGNFLSTSYFLHIGESISMVQMAYEKVMTYSKLVQSLEHDPTTT